MKTLIICGSTHGAWDEWGAHCPTCNPPDPRDAEIARLKAEVERLGQEKSEALAANADLRAGIVHVVQHQANHRIPMPIAYIDDLLARTDLGAGMVAVVPIDYVALGIIQDARDVLAKTFKSGAVNDIYGLIKRIDALLDGGKGRG